jgi:hypothetical protein
MILAALFAKVGEIVVANVQALRFQGIQHEGAHGHIGFISQTAELFAQILTEAKRKLGDRFCL